MTFPSPLPSSASTTLSKGCGVVVGVGRGTAEGEACGTSVDGEGRSASHAINISDTTGMTIIESNFRLEDLISIDSASLRAVKIGIYSPSSSVMNST